MNITTASLSAQGERASNQDQLGERLGSRAACFIVCDGIAGFPGGEVAARLACDNIISHFDAEGHLDAQHVRQYVNNANQAIRAGQQATPEHARMGTTLVGLFVDRDYQLAYCAHAGDSRLYLFRRGWLHHVTTDHSLVQQMKDAGHETEGMNNNLLYFALGMNDDSREASYSYLEPVEDGDVFLLCTDGFWHGVSEEQMKQTLHLVNTPQEWLTLMNQIIINNNNDSQQRQDNYSALAVWMGSPQETTLLHSPADAIQLLSSRD